MNMQRFLPKLPKLRMLAMIALLAGVAACGNNQQVPGVTSQGQQLRQAVTQIFKGRPAPQDVRKLLTPAFLAQVPRPFMVIENQDSKASSTMSVVATNKDVSTWLMGDLSTIALDRLGLVQATRGFGRDLMTADTRELARLLRTGGRGNTLRVHRYLDGSNQVQTRSYICTVTALGPETVSLVTGRFPTQAYQEDCATAKGEGFINTYWYEQSSGVLRQSKQWISPEVGFVLLERLYL